MSALPDDSWFKESQLDSQAIVFAVGDIDWEPALLSALRHPTIRLNITKRCLDAIELVAAIESSNAGQAFVSATLARLDLEIVARLKRRHVVITGIVDSSQEQDEVFLRQLGVEHIVALNTERPGAAAASLASALKVETAAEHDSQLLFMSREVSTAATGRVIVVWGPPGSTGKSTVAMNIADEIGAGGRKVLLMDCDVDSPSLAIMLAVSESPGGLAVALRRATAGRLDAAALEELSVEVTPNVRVLVGSGVPGHRAELRSPAFASLRDTAAHLFDVVVIDLGSVPLPVEGLGEQASLSTLDALDDASDVVVVGGSTLVDVQRLIHCVDSLKEALPRVNPHILINRSEPSSDIVTALSTHCSAPPQRVRFIPEDSKVLSACMRDGLTVRETAARSKVRAHLHAVGQDLVSECA